MYGIPTRQPIICASLDKHIGIYEATDLYQQHVNNDALTHTQDLIRPSVRAGEFFANQRGLHHGEDHQTTRPGDNVTSVSNHASNAGTHHSAGGDHPGRVSAHAARAPALAPVRASNTNNHGAASHAHATSAANGRERERELNIVPERQVARERGQAASPALAAAANYIMTRVRPVCLSARMSEQT
jgi:hypothetical protein